MRLQPWIFKGWTQSASPLPLGFRGWGQVRQASFTQLQPRRQGLGHLQQILHAGNLRHVEVWGFDSLAINALQSTRVRVWRGQWNTTQLIVGLIFNTEVLIVQCIIHLLYKITNDVNVIHLFISLTNHLNRCEFPSDFMFKSWMIKYIVIFGLVIMFCWFFPPCCIVYS